MSLTETLLVWASNPRPTKGPRGLCSGFSLGMIACCLSYLPKNNFPKNFQFLLFNSHQKFRLTTMQKKSAHPSNSIGHLIIRPLTFKLLPQTSNSTHKLWKKLDLVYCKIFVGDKSKIVKMVNSKKNQSTIFSPNKFSAITTTSITAKTTIARLRERSHLFVSKAI